MGVWDVLILLLLAAAIWGAFRFLRRQKSCCCGNCAACKGCKSKQE
ncbi:MAG: hypothetical protein ACOX83_00660 [Candidatus Spyradocola sp.]|jgi:hypothetical protein